MARWLIGWLLVGRGRGEDLSRRSLSESRINHDTPNTDTMFRMSKLTPCGAGFFR
jgi:hypothetical protein